MAEQKFGRYDEKFMRRALALAAKGRGRTSPNPMVGAVIVKKRRIIGQGYHKKIGSLHAEIIALQEAGREAAGATLYLNLEPCCHYGLTPPCVREVIKAGLKRVVIAMADPNPKVNGKGIAALRKAGITTEVGLLAQEAEQLNEAFVKYITTGLPFVILKLAMSLDGKIATKTGDSKWITSERSRNYVHKLRDQVDAVCVGIGTILRDNSRLTSRLKGRKGRDPVRVIVDSLLKVPLRANIFTEKSTANNIIVTTRNSFFKRKREIERTGSVLLEVGTCGRNKVDLLEMARELGKRGITSLMIEGGAEIAASALQVGIIDKLVFFLSPKIVGGKSAPGPVGGEGIAMVSDAIKLHRLKTKHFGEDIMIEAYLKDTLTSARGLQPECGCSQD